jgi:Xaa-Pro aminopeptidase
MPYVSEKSDTIVEDGMVYTIEPGIYIPGEFGIRIEDMVAMVSGRAVVL